MYSNERKNGFSILDLLIKIIFAGVFIFILVWLFQKKIPNINMKPFYSNVFRENIKYMQDAGESYFTDDKMPQTVGERIQLTLGEMEDKNLIIPFVDKDGNACDKKESYVSVTKLEDGYELKTNLVCSKESNFLIKVLGCHNYCKDGDCNKTCSVEKITQYQYKKLVNGTKTNYSCASGYSLNGEYCYKTVLKDTKDATYKTTETVTVRKPAKMVTGDATITLLTTVVSNKKVQVDKITTTTPATTKTESQAYSCTKTRTEKQAYNCTKTKTEESCNTTYESQGYACDCAVRYVNGVPKTTCNTCYKSIPVTTCKDVTVNYTDICYKDVSVNYTDTCYKDVTVTVPGTTTYSCPSNTTSEGSGANLKCYKTEKVYSCPSGTDTQTGSGANLKCYKVTSGSVSYVCEDAGYKLDKSNNTCYKTEQSTSTTKECKLSGYKLEGDKCNLYETEKVKATATKVKTSYYTYKWSEQESLSGYTRTGKTKVVDGEEICK